MAFASARSLASSIGRRGKCGQETFEDKVIHGIYYIRMYLYVFIRVRFCAYVYILYKYVYLPLVCTYLHIHLYMWMSTCIIVTLDKLEIFAVARC